MRIGAAGLVLVGGALCAPLTAQQLPIYRLGEIVVSARLPVTEAAATLRVVTAEDVAAAGELARPRRRVLFVERTDADPNGTDRMQPTWRALKLC
jgi:hypothetical protein